MCYFYHFPHVTKEIERCALSKSYCLKLLTARKPLPKIAFQILFGFGLKLLLVCYFYNLAFSSCNQGDWIIKIELSKITYNFESLFKLEQKLLLLCFFCHFSSRWGLLVNKIVNGKDPNVRSISYEIPMGIHLSK